jgi:GMP synthase (glutamine-hydrolysing)
MQDSILILDFGSQYTQLIARRIREMEVYSEIRPFSNIPADLSEYKGIVLSGSPFSVRDVNALQIDLSRIIGKLPVLGICYGAQYIAHSLGGKVEKSDKREYGKASLALCGENDPLFENVNTNSQVWMSHGDTITILPDGFELLAKTNDIPIAAFGSCQGKYENAVYCLQFHPEVTHSTDGYKMLENFVRKIAGCEGKWTPAAFVKSTVEELKNKIGNQHVILGLSGGVDSSVAAALLHKAIGNQLICVFIDNGLLRKNEYEEVLLSYKDMGLRVVGVDAKNYFYKELKDIADPETKRKIIGKAFIDIFEQQAKLLEGSDHKIAFLAQGTIYPDVIESVSVHGPSVTIKSHHNVGGLPEKLNLKIVEPLRMLFKDEVRKVGREMLVPPDILNRHPFPGPGLGIRILGDITVDKVRLLQEADAIFINGLKEEGLYHEVWQAATILLPVFAVGVMGDERTYEQVVALRAVTSLDGMTAEWCHLPYSFLGKISTEIINQVKGINRVVYDISTKPPATIEWE